MQELLSKIDKDIKLRYKREKILLMKIASNSRNGDETKQLAREALKVSRMAYRRYIGQEKYEHKAMITTKLNKFIVQELF